MYLLDVAYATDCSSFQKYFNLKQEKYKNFIERNTELYKERIIPIIIAYDGIIFNKSVEMLKTTLYSDSK